MALLCVKLIFRKNGSFSSQHIHDSKALKEKGIHCVMDQEGGAQKRHCLLMSACSAINNY